MIKAYRLVKRKWSLTAFDGQGAKRHGGRWNSKGSACVYLMESVALGLLKVMAHANDYAILKHDTVFELQFDSADVMQLSEESLPDDWLAYPAPHSTASIGDE